MFPHAANRSVTSRWVNSASHSSSGPLMVTSTRSVSLTAYMIHEDGAIHRNDPRPAGPGIRAPAAPGRRRARPPRWWAAFSLLAAPGRAGRDAVSEVESGERDRTRPEHVLLVAEVVSPGSETTDRIVKVEQYARAGIAFYWRIEQAATGVPLIYTYILDPATGSYRSGEMFTGVVEAAAPFPVKIDLGRI
ncbi:Uma2 family endonuclease [Nocardia testacea]|uniref:Uma2 family endonuclease n=1 Tax=Nocardia testacea TaxID=248551 RepID=UPI003A8A12E7